MGITATSGCAAEPTHAMDGEALPAFAAGSTATPTGPLRPKRPASLGGWGPVQPANIRFTTTGAPFASDFGEAYPHGADALARAERVFLSGNRLPDRWAGCRRFVVLECGFGLGHNFLATWAAWRAHGPAGATLHYVALDKHPPRPSDLQRAHAMSPLPDLAERLCAAWPALTPDMHLLDFGSGPAPKGCSGRPADPQALGGQPAADDHRRAVGPGGVRLLLAFGDMAQVLPELVLQADAVYLDGFSPERNPAMWGSRLLRSLHRLAAPGATVALQTVAPTVLDGLVQAGFVMQRHGWPEGSGNGGGNGVDRAHGRLAPAEGDAGHREQAPSGRSSFSPAMASGSFAPRHRATPPPGRRCADGVRHVVVVGAGLAGAAVADALGRQGLLVTVLEADAAPAQQTSGNAGGLFHSVVHPQDGAHARWLRAAALLTERRLRPLLAKRLPHDAHPQAPRWAAQGPTLRKAPAVPVVDGRPEATPYPWPDASRGSLPGALNGLLRGEGRLNTAAMQALLEAQAQPPEHVQVRAHALPDGRPAWYFAGGGWVAPAALVRHWLGGPHITLRGGVRVQTLQARPEGWRLLDTQGRVLADADAVVLASAGDVQRLLGGPAWPLESIRGQTTVLPTDLPGLPALPSLPLPLADGGYALRLADGRVLCGAVSQPGDPEPGLRAADHMTHVATLRRLTGWAGQLDAGALDKLEGRVGWRLSADDRLPVLGPVPLDLPAPAPPDALCEWRNLTGTNGARDRHGSKGADHAGRQRRAGAAGNVESTKSTTMPVAPAPRHAALTQARWVPRQPGLYVFTALGSRGITQAALGAEVLAAWLTGTPSPVPASLMDAVDAARFAVRAVRKLG